MKRWAVTLPILMLLTGCTTSAPAAPAPRVVTLGDSVPAGTACDCTPFPDLYAHRIGATSDNLADPGSTSADVRTELTTAQPPVAAANVVLVMTGANDLAEVFDSGGGSYTTAADTVQRNVTAIVNAVHNLQPTARILVFGYWNVVEDGDVGHADYGDDGVAEAASATAACNQALHRAATATGATYVDTITTFKGESGEENPTNLLTADGDHPNAAGHAALAAAAYAVLPQIP